MKHYSFLTFLLLVLFLTTAGQAQPTLEIPTPTPTAMPGEGSTVDPMIAVTLPSGVTMEMVSIPAGSFQMGRYPGEQDSFDREDPQHQVNIGYQFYMGKTE